MRRKIISTMFFVSLLTLAATSIPTCTAAKPKVVLHAKGALQADRQLQAIMNNITWVNWVLVMGELTASDLADAKMLISVRVDAALSYTASELEAIDQWFSTGGKAIWVAGDSDYPSDNGRVLSGNALFEYLGSVLRFESCETVDPETNAGADYRVYGVPDNCAPELSFLVQGVNYALFHGPGLIVGYYDGEYHKLEAERPSNVYLIMTSSPTGTTAEFTEPVAQVHEVGETGEFPLLVMEINYANKNIVIASADGPFDHYTGMYMPELYGIQRYSIDYPQQGAILFKNIVDFVLSFADTMITQYNQITTMQGQISTLQGQITSLQGQVSTLQGEVDNLESQVTAAQGNVTMWQGIAIALLVVGLVVGVAVKSLMKK
ncbi:hypothetical protein KEJ18_00345 [Candidatus Bathyarchaeota archaeon]|nr:hypothetical protein [Candidatus Bathyarchaeota archaeon]